jgi:hypothetical protein
MVHAHRAHREEVAQLIRYLSLGFKDLGYKEERETRILTQPNDPFSLMAPLKFRMRGADIVPYVSLAPKFILAPSSDGSLLQVAKTDVHPPLLTIRRIVIGPGVDYFRNKSSLERLLVAQGYKGVEILKSSIPFRP